MSQPEDDFSADFGHTAGYVEDPNAGHLLSPDGWMVPRRYTATMDVVGLPRVVLEVEVSPADGKPICRTLRVEGSDPDGITGAVLRKLPVKHLLRTSLAGVATKVAPDADGTTRAVPITGEDVQALKRTRSAPQLPPRGERTTDPALLEQVAAIYRASPEKPTLTVSQRLGYSRAHAGRLVMEARRRGYLGPAVGTRAGEAIT